MMRRYETSDWVSLLPRAVELLNARPMTRNGGVPPEDINSFMDDPIVREAREKNGVTFPEPNREAEIKSEEQFNQSVAGPSKPKLMVGSFVFLDKKQKTFDKSFELQVITFILCCVESQAENVQNNKIKFFCSKIKHFGYNISCYYFAGAACFFF